VCKQKVKKTESNRDALLKNQLIYSPLKTYDLDTDELELGLLSLRKKIKEAQRQLLDVKNS
jgi:hypothetical protein